LAALSVGLVPEAARAHDAFGDLGPFFGALLHPLADPGQGLILGALAVLLARQPLVSVRLAYVALLVACLCVTALHAVWPMAAPSTRIVGALATGVGLLAVWGGRVPRPMLAGLAVGAGVLAGLASDGATGDTRTDLLAALGGMAGTALVVLLLWAALDVLQDRLGRVAGAVAASWVAAVGLMMAALPTMPA
jgi:hypothetical protein